MPKRRANGEGNIRKRKDGRWEGRYTVGHDPETGKAIIKNVLGKTQAEVKEKLKKAIEENVGIDYGRAKTYTVGSWLEVWMENYAKIKLRPSTFKTSQGFLKNHIKPQIGSIPLAGLTSLDLQQFYKHLLDGGRVDRIEAKKKPKGLAPKTVRNIHQMIGSAYNLAMEQKLVTRNPTQGCALPKVEHKEMKTLTADQLSAFFQEARDSGVYELYYLDLATGPRREASFEDKHLILYGHNMRTRSMFGSLHEFESEDFYKKYNKIYLYQPEKVMKYTVYSVYDCLDKSTTYLTDFTGNKKDERWMDWLSMTIEKNAYYPIKKKPEKEGQILTLSTCSGKKKGNDYRLVVNAVIK